VPTSTEKNNAHIEDILKDGVKKKKKRRCTLAQQYLSAQQQAYYLATHTQPESKIESPNNLADGGLPAVGNFLMDLVYLGCNIAFLSLAILSFVGAPPTGLAILTLWLSCGWNYFDGVGGLINASDQANKKENTPLLINGAASTQLIVFTALANLGKTIGLTALAGGAFTGFSFAACMLAGFLIESHLIKDCEKRKEIVIAKIQSLSYERRLLLLSDPRSRDDNTSKNVKAQLKAQLKEIDTEIETLGEIKEFLEDRIKDHHHGCYFWAGCTIAMTALAIASVCSGGAVLAGLTIAFGVVATLTGCYRLYCTQRKSHVDKRRADKLREKGFELTPPKPNLFLNKTLLWKSDHRFQDKGSHSCPFENRSLSFSTQPSQQTFSRNEPAVAAGYLGKCTK